MDEDKQMEDAIDLAIDDVKGCDQEDQLTVLRMVLARTYLLGARNELQNRMDRLGEPTP